MITPQYISHKIHKRPKGPVLSTQLIFFILTWVFYAGYYGDVLFIAQQYSFFSTDLTVMNDVWDHSYGILWMIGRALLQLCYYPWLGSLLLALMLTLISWLFGYVCKIRGSYSYLKFIPSIIYSFVIIFKGFDIYYQAETGAIMGIPFCMLFILVCQSFFVRSFSKKKMPPLFRQPEDEKIWNNWKTNILIVLSLFFLLFFNEWQRSYVRPTARMQRLLEEKDWNAMRATAESHDMGFSTIAAYYAISRMGDRNDVSQVPIGILPQPSKPIYLHDRNGNKDTGRNYFLTDYCIASGQNKMAYALTVSHLESDGPSAYLLKRLIWLCLQLEKHEEAQHYMNLLSLLPFEKQFISEIESLIKK